MDNSPQSTLPHRFPPTTILSVFTGQPLPPDSTDGLIALLTYMVYGKEEKLYNPTPTQLRIEINFYREIVLPHLIKQHRELYEFSEFMPKDNSVQLGNENNFQKQQEWVARIEYHFGKNLIVRKITPSPFANREAAMAAQNTQAAAALTDPLREILRANDPGVFSNKKQWLLPCFNNTTVRSHLSELMIEDPHRPREYYRARL
jgi:hypothetical protein